MPARTRARISAMRCGEGRRIVARSCMACRAAPASRGGLGGVAASVCCQWAPAVAMTAGVRWSRRSSAQVMAAWVMAAMPTAGSMRRSTASMPGRSQSGRTMAVR